MLQDSASPLQTQLILFHEYTLGFLLLIVATVALWLATASVNNLSNRRDNDNQTIETVWTVAPMVVLLFIALPSLRLLYLCDEVKTPALTIKTVGSQWYWSYEYSDFNQLSRDSYMIPNNNLPGYLPHLLEVDNRLTLPVGTQTRLMVTAADVIHSWTVPSLGVKVDAVPGRLNQLSVYLDRPGLFYGQCSEICGANHSFMPIVVEGVSLKHFLAFV